VDGDANEAYFLPRILAERSPSSRPLSSHPSSRMLPIVIANVEKSPRIAPRQRTDLPLPYSPTITDGLRRPLESDRIHDWNGSASPS